MKDDDEPSGRPGRATEPPDQHLTNLRETRSTLRPL